ncbi:MAG TPA: hypothetical protein VMW36_00980 [Patescibacteria group bacterium]|nr:hypothetical protein [Patescibacteria group bacterium]
MMEKIRNLKYLIIIFFLVFWYLLSEKLSSDPSLTLATISF